MSWSSFVPVFHVLVWLHLALGYVEPPTNVTFHCHNLKNILRWRYEQPQPGLKFKVTIGAMYSPIRHLWLDPPTQHADLSFLPPNDSYYLKVAAVVNNNETYSKGLTFSYEQSSDAKHKCVLDLPPVNITSLPDAMISFSFAHPSLLYFNNMPKTTGRKKRRDSYEEGPELLPEFKYKVTLDENNHDYICEESVCEEHLPVDVTQQKHCLKVTGELNNIKVKGNQSYCAAAYKEEKKMSNGIYIMIALLAIGAAAAFVSLMVYWKKSSPSSPFVILDRSPINKSNTQQILSVNGVEISALQVEPTSPTPLLDKEEGEIISTVIPDTSNTHIPLRPNDEGVFDVSDEEQSIVVGDGYSVKNLDEGGEESDQDFDNEDRPEHGYERRPVLVQLAPDERNEGYRG